MHINAKSYCRKARSQQFRLIFRAIYYTSINEIPTKTHNDRRRRVARKVLYLLFMTSEVGSELLFCRNFPNLNARRKQNRN